MSIAHPRATLAATILGSSLAFIDSSVVNVALPALATGLHADASTLPWAITVYLLPLSALILLGGGLGDRFGRRRYFLIGLVTFTVASVLCAGAPAFSWLLAGRGLQGLGAALLMPNSLAILGSQFQGEARGRAVGIWSAAGALGGVAGPVIGGWLVDEAGWRAIFFVNVPLALACGYLAFYYVAENTDREHAAALDTTGALLATFGLGLVTWSLTQSSGRGTAGLSLWSAAAVGVLLLVAFVWNERRLQDHALMPLVMFASPAFVGLSLYTFFLWGSLGGLVVLVPFLLIKMERWSAVAGGAALLPIPTLIGLGSRSMGRWASRHGARTPLLLGSLLAAAGFALFAARIGPGLSYWADVFPPTLLIALGLCACVAPLTTGIMESVDAEHVGIAAGSNSAVARIAGLIATSLLGFVFARGDSLQFIAAFWVAALVGASWALAATACVYFYLGPRSGSRSV